MPAWAVPVHFNRAVEPTETFFLELHSRQVPADTSDRCVVTMHEGILDLS